MELLERPLFAPLVTPPVVETDERAARRNLRAQIAKLERDVAAHACAAFPDVELTSFAAGRAGPRLLTLGDLETVRDQLATRLAELRQSSVVVADRQEAKRLLIEQMLLEPGEYKWVRVQNADIGQPGCKSWHVRPRLGLIGMLAGWWHVKISSGCPLPGGPWRTPRPRPH